MEIVYIVKLIWTFIKESSRKQNCNDYYVKYLKEFSFLDKIKKLAQNIFKGQTNLK